ncbi:opsin [Penaeus vannamei]|uniref:Opsin n=1 Tax=Penaeus vannamei TaxID=6689 RepID=A0A423SZW9_PENVA|nr:opsin [Penaeus vannamei]
MSTGAFNATDPAAYRGGGVSFGYPQGFTLMDFVPDDVKPLIHSHWSNFPPVNPMWHYMLAGIYVVLGFLSFFGNGVVMYLFLSKKRLRSPANMFVVNLAFSDFMMMLSQFPMFVTNCLSGGYWSLGAFACRVYGFLGTVFGLTSLVTLVAIGYDRYCVIVKAFDGGHISSGKAFVIIVLCWAYSVAVSIWPFFGWNSYIPEGILTSCSFDYLSHDWNVRSFGIFLFVMCYCFPLTIIIFVYSQIVGAIRQHEKALREQAKKMNVENLRSNADAKKQSAEVRIAKVAVANVFLWLLTWTPYAYVVMIDSMDQTKVTPLVSALPALIAKTASVYNPIMFAISHPKFRLALQEAMHGSASTKRRTTTRNPRRRKRRTQNNSLKRKSK